MRLAQKKNFFFSRGTARTDHGEDLGYALFPWSSPRRSPSDFQIAGQFRMLARLPSLGWALSVAFIGNGSCFQPAGAPFGRIDSRGRTTGAKSSPNFVSTTRRQHVSEAARVVRPDSSESGFGQARDKHGEGGEDGEGFGRRPLLVDYFVR